eukprot:m.11613 g.11613  ORF g.11613 m.11613 type:complete len:241 (+) comp3168_c0_seq2:223-945(+)
MASTTVFCRVHGNPPTLCEDDFWRCIDIVGVPTSDVRNVVVVRHEDMRSKGFGYVECASAKMAAVLARLWSGRTIDSKEWYACVMPQEIPEKTSRMSPAELKTHADLTKAIKHRNHQQVLAQHQRDKAAKEARKAGKANYFRHGHGRKRAELSTSSSSSLHREDEPPAAQSDVHAAPDARPVECVLSIDELCKAINKFYPLGEVLALRDGDNIRLLSSETKKHPPPHEVRLAPRWSSVTN